jgi:hypothetical protein
MGFLSFLRHKKIPLKERLDKMFDSMFPKGEKDVKAGTKELLCILNNKIDYGTARTIFLKSIAISRIAKEFDKERLKIHLTGYCIHHFNEAQIEKYYNYLVALSTAMLIHNRTPSEVRRVGDAYVW